MHVVGARAVPSMKMVTGDPKAAALAATGIFATPVVVAGDRAFLAYPRGALAVALGFRCRCPDAAA
ncbi:MAG: hypothetical protein AVDCRST_MAG59-2000 [uncultured Thermomicrobiales bacterium]|uniref:Uncharacterized protein n=1 Tax=uncultured Thermomicrobiales bacterium TaxID=1645740 RepID=A0A6J4UNW2_9BACT|nr:MAG: hypothetical protein AVDCRST_MAG59-2000 [uncultured Thermomicrobiales bacterium]